MQEINFQASSKARVAGCLMPIFHLLKHRNFLPAAVCCVGTARCGIYILRWIVGTWHVTFQNDTLTFLLHIRERDCGKKGFCIGVHRIGIKLGFFCNLNHTSKIHNCDSVTDMADYAQVMGDKQVGQFFFCCIFLIRFSTCARTDTSSAETASSQTTNSGFRISALAIPIRCL